MRHVDGFIVNTGCEVKPVPAKRHFLHRRLRGLARRSHRQAIVAVIAIRRGIPLLGMCRARQQQQREDADAKAVKHPLNLRAIRNLEQRSGPVTLGRVTTSARTALVPKRSWNAKVIVTREDYVGAVRASWLVIESTKRAFVQLGLLRGRR